MNVIIFGATGMVGGEVLRQCLANEAIHGVVTVGRRASGFSHPKLKEVIHADFHDFSALEAELWRVDLCLYCLGVYQAHVSRARFWEVTVDYLRALIDLVEKANPSLRFCLFSAQGASRSGKSPIRFARAKGRAETLLLESGIAEKHIFRPGYIKPGSGKRNTTLSAMLAEPIYRLFPPLGIDAPDLARVMIEIGLVGHDRTTWENRDIRAFRTRTGS